MKGWIGFVVSLPILALFGGVGVLAYGISETWQTRHNDMVIIALALSCLGIVLVVAVASTLFMMYAYRLRQMREFEQNAMQRPAVYLPPGSPDWAAPAPKMLPKPQEGSWESMQVYDLAESTESEESINDW